MSHIYSLAPAESWSDPAVTDCCPEAFGVVASGEDAQQKDIWILWWNVLMIITALWLDTSCQWWLWNVFCNICITCWRLLRGARPYLRSACPHLPDIEPLLSITYYLSRMSFSFQQICLKQSIAFVFLVLNVLFKIPHSSCAPRVKGYFQTTNLK